MLAVETSRELSLTGLSAGLSRVSPLSGVRRTLDQGLVSLDSGLGSLINSVLGPAEDHSQFPPL